MKTRLIALTLVAACTSTAWAADQAGAKAERPHRHEAAQRWKTADTDKDGAINKQEAGAAKMQHLSSNFDKIDTNKDGKVSREEMRAARHSHKAAKQ